MPFWVWAAGRTAEHLARLRNRGYMENPAFWRAESPGQGVVFAPRSLDSLLVAVTRE